MTAAARLTVEELRKTHWQFVMHIRFAGWSQITYQCVEFPEVRMVSVSVTRKAKDTPEPGRYFFIRGVEQEFVTIDAVVAALNARRGAQGEDACR